MNKTEIFYLSTLTDYAYNLLLDRLDGQETDLNKICYHLVNDFNRDDFYDSIQFHNFSIEFSISEDFEDIIKKYKGDYLTTEFEHILNNLKGIAIENKKAV